jgi:hypothetical protein
LPTNVYVPIYSERFFFALISKLHLKTKIRNYYL